MPEKRIEFFLINSALPKTSGRGKEYTTLQMFERGGRAWQAMLWEKAELAGGDIVKAQVEESEYNGSLQLTVAKVRKATEEELKKVGPEDFLPKTPYSIDGMLAELESIFESVASEPLRALLRRLVTSDERWRRAAAAKQMHHAYLGGLLEHTLNMCRIARLLCPLYPWVNGDLVLVGCALHDSGKIEELSQGASIEYTLRGELLGHITLGIVRASGAMNEDPEAFGTTAEPKELRLRVLHMIGSHHGPKQYGSVKEPCTPEAAMLCKIDGTDADMAAMKAAIDKAPPGAAWTEKVKWETRYFLGEGAKGAEKKAEEEF